jgi:hypothetical protein
MSVNQRLIVRDKREGSHILHALSGKQKVGPRAIQLCRSVLSRVCFVLWNANIIML